MQERNRKSMAGDRRYNLAVAEAEAALAEIGLDLDLTGKAKGPGQGTRFRTQRRDAGGHWVEEGSPGGSKPARKPSARPAPKKPAKPALSHSDRESALERAYEARRAAALAASKEPAKPAKPASKPSKPATTAKKPAGDADTDALDRLEAAYRAEAEAKPKPELERGKPGETMKQGDLRAHYAKVNKGMPGHVHRAFEDYIGGTSFHINGNLRQGNDLADLQDMADGMDEGMRPLPGPVTSYRGMDGSWEDLFGSKPEVGGVIEDAGYLSTSLDKSVAESFGSDGVQIEVEIPAGIKAMSMGSVPGGNGQDPEQELLLARGQRMQITEVKQVYMGWNDETGGFEPDPNKNDPDGFFLDHVKVKVLP